MGTKLKIDGDEIDMVRGMNIPKEGELLFIKRKGDTGKTYVVESVSHTIDFNLGIALSKTLINLEEIKDIEED